MQWGQALLYELAAQTPEMGISLS